MDGAQLALIAIIFVAYTMGSALGFGTSLLVVTFGSQLFPLDVLLPVVAPLNIALALYLSIRYRKLTPWEPLRRRILPLAGLGIPAGLLLFNLRDLGFLRLAFGLFVVTLAGFELRASLRRREGSRRLSRGWGGALLFGGGLVHGMFGTGGPLLVYVIGREVGGKGSIRATLATMWVPLNAALLFDYAVTGLVTRQVAVTLAAAVLPVAAGIAIGELAHHRLERRRFERAMWGVLLAGGVVLTARALGWA